MTAGGFRGMVGNPTLRGITTLMSNVSDPNDLRTRWEDAYGPGSTGSRSDAGATHRPQVDGPDATLSGLATFAQTLSGGLTFSDRDPAAHTAGRSAIPGGYDLLGEVGRGGMGVVYRARQRTLARDIALKFIKPGAAGGAARERFVSEALVNGLLDHPNIVPVHELGTNHEGDVYLAMKLVGGRSWKQLLHPATAEDRAAAAGYDLDRHLAVLHGVGNAIAFAHSRGIVHRDLKPENVMVGEFGEVLVMDWGIAVDIRDQPDADRRAPHRSTITAPSGTPSYMAPELAEGRGRDIGPATDVYLLGAILHEILAGAPPHRGSTLLEVLVAASRSVAPAYGSGVPAGLAAIAATAMARDPASRYPTVAAFQAALGDYAKHRDSQKIADGARARLAEAEGMAAGADATARSRRYAGYAEAVAGFRQALVLWEANPQARDGGRDARLAYARAALAGGDLGLAEAQLDTVDHGAGSLREEIAAARTAAAVRERAAVRNRRLLVGAGAVILIGLGTGYALVSAEKDRAVDARQRAEEQRQEADLQRGLAAAERDKALVARAEAERAGAEVRRRFAGQALAERDHAATAGDRGAALLWQAAAVERSGGDPLQRLALLHDLTGLPEPIHAAQAVGEAGPDGKPLADEEGAALHRLVVAAMPTARRDRVLVVVQTATETGSGIATETSRRFIGVWDPLRDPSQIRFDGATGTDASGGVLVDPQGRRAVFDRLEEGLTAYTIADGGLLRTAALAVDTAGISIERLAFSPDGAFVYGEAEDHGIVVLDAETLTVRHRTPPAESSRGILASEDGRWVATDSGRGTAVLLDARTWKPICDLGALNRLTGLAVRPDGKHAVVLGNGELVVLAATGGGWTVAGRHPARELGIPDEPLPIAADQRRVWFSADGATLHWYDASVGGTVRRCGLPLTIAADGTVRAGAWSGTPLATLTAEQSTQAPVQRALDALEGILGQAGDGPRNGGPLGWISTVTPDGAVVLSDPQRLAIQAPTTVEIADGSAPAAWPVPTTSTSAGGKVPHRQTDEDGTSFTVRGAEGTPARRITLATSEANGASEGLITVSEGAPGAWRPTGTRIRFNLWSGATADADVSADGRRIAFCEQDQLVLVDADGGREIARLHLDLLLGAGLERFGSVSTARWAGDRHLVLSGSRLRDGAASPTAALVSLPQDPGTAGDGRRTALIEAIAGRAIDAGGRIVRLDSDEVRERLHTFRGATP